MGEGEMSRESGTHGRAVIGAVHSTVDRLGERAGESLSETATWLKEAAPETGPLAAPVGFLAEHVHRLGTYLQETNGMAAVEDLIILVRRYPVQAIAIAGFVGYLIARSRRGRKGR